MSQASKIRDYLAKLPTTNEDGFIPLDIDKMASDLNTTRKRLLPMMSNLVSRGLWDWEKNDEGRIIGFKNLRPLKDLRRREAKQEAARAGTVKEAIADMTRRIVSTPEIDRLSEAKSAMQRFVEQFPGVVDEAKAAAALHIDPEKAEAYANEGMALLARNRHLERRNSELVRRVRELERENGYLKQKNDEKLREGLVNAGVVHAHD